MITNDYRSKSTVETQRAKTQNKAEENLKKANEKQIKVIHFVSNPSFKAKEEGFGWTLFTPKSDLLNLSPGAKWSRIPIIIGELIEMLSYHMARLFSYQTA